MRYEVVTKPGIQVVSLQQVKAHLRLDHAEDDEYLMHLIGVATEWVEEVIEAPLLTTTYVATSGAGKIILPKQYVQEVISVIGVARNRVRTALKYTLESDSHLAIMTTTNCPQVEIKFAAGFGARPTDVPALLRQAILNHVTCFYEHRTEISKDQYLTLLQLVHPYRKLRL